jgi:hypothetical protein
VVETVAVDQLPDQALLAVIDAAVQAEFLGLGRKGYSLARKKNHVLPDDTHYP